MEILIDNRQSSIEFDQETLKTTSRQILEDLACSPETALSIAFVDAEEMERLNMKYREKQTVSNVLSFSQSEGIPVVSGAELLGDVVICVNRVVDDSRELGYTHDEMILFLLIHGILHLLGQEHDTPESDESMARKVQEIFNRYYPD